MVEITTSGGFSLTPIVSTESRLALLLWGQSGCGKTELAATAPGKILWILHDHDGLAAVSQHNKDKISVIDFSREDSRTVADVFRKPNPFDLDGLLKKNPEIRTVVFDSATSFKEKMMPHAVKVASMTPKGKGATMEDPGFSGWGNINTWVRAAFVELLTITAKHNVNMIFTAHEDTPEMNDQGVVMRISIMLGGKITPQTSKDLSEVWWMHDDNGKARYIAIRTCRKREPMRTRMFKTESGNEFKWNYDAETGRGEGIATWIDRWHKAGTKIDLPK